MCGRFAQIEPISRLIKLFMIDDTLTEASPSYNIAPGSRVISVVQKEGKRLLLDFQWGLVPGWVKDPAIGQSLINARAETISQKPSFRGAFKARRCLVVASGFYEWKREGWGKIPYFIRMASREPLAFAGIHETWTSPQGAELNTCAIITTGPNSLMEQIHNRMPVILSGDRQETWLDTAIQPETALTLLAPYSADEMEAYPVSTLVNSPKNNVAACIEPA
ncbi:MAG: SOS response-associated peptidase [Spirochaetes bacterium]|nr:SOS response-associated peptidase [Spirochaetota bacterium]